MMVDFIDEDVPQYDNSLHPCSGCPYDVDGVCTSDPAAHEQSTHEQCSHCNGYGSSLKEASDKCTRCGGSGIVKKGSNDDNGDK